MPHRSLSSSTLRDAVRRAFQDWPNSAPDSPLGALRIVRAYCAETDRSLGYAINQILLNLLNRLENQEPDLAQILRLRYLDRLGVAKVANRLNLSESTVFRKQRQALAWIAERLSQEEETAQEEHRRQIEERLEPPSYQKLFGVGPHLRMLQELLESSEPPWIVLLQGIGGIGKTALADAFVRQALERSFFEEFGWVTARRYHFHLDGTVTPVADSISRVAHLWQHLARQLLDEPLPSPFSLEQTIQLFRRRLKKRKCLIVIDNLETLTDLEALLPILDRLAPPIKFLLTSRRSLESKAGIFLYNLQPLSQEDALALVRYEARLRNIPALAQASDEDLRVLYQVVGGNPLALRLVVGQVRRHSLASVLQDLQKAQGRPVEQLYTFIYWQAWQRLNETERQVLLAMPLAAENGVDLDFLRRIVGMEDGVLHDALDTLTQLSLVDHVSLGASESRYTIHGLTRTFLLEQVLHWQEDDTPAVSGPVEE